MTDKVNTVTPQQVAAYLYTVITNNPTLSIPARESEMMTVSKNWLRGVAETEPVEDTPEATNEQTEDS